MKNSSTVMVALLAMAVSIASLVSNRTEVKTSNVDTWEQSFQIEPNAYKLVSENNFLLRNMSNMEELKSKVDSGVFKPVATNISFQTDTSDPEVEYPQLDDQARRLENLESSTSYSKEILNRLDDIETLIKDSACNCEPIVSMRKEVPATSAGVFQRFYLAKFRTGPCGACNVWTSNHQSNIDSNVPVVPYYIDTDMDAAAYVERPDVSISIVPAFEFRGVKSNGEHVVLKRWKSKLGTDDGIPTAEEINQTYESFR